MPRAALLLSVAVALWVVVGATEAATFGLSIRHTESNGVVFTAQPGVTNEPFAVYQSIALPFTNWTRLRSFSGTTSRVDVAVPLISGGSMFFRAARASVSGFEGLSLSDTGITPPDTTGAVGPRHFVELLNGKVAVFDKGTGERCAEAWTTNFFALTNNSAPPSEVGLFEGRIEFDAQAGRWVACAIDAFGSGELFLAVSHGDSPTNLLAGWTNWRLPVAHPTSLTSSTTLGLDDHGIYLSVWHTDPDNGHTVIAIKKPEIYEGQLVWWTNDVPVEDLKTRSIRPAVNLDPGETNAFVWFIAKGPPEAGPPYRGGAFFCRRLQWKDGMPDWADPDWRAVDEDPVGYRDYCDLEAGNVTAPQKGGPTEIGLAHTGSRPMTVLKRDGFLWICQHIGLDGTNDVYDGGTVDRSAVQWLKLEPGPDGALACVEKGRIYDPAPVDPLWYYMPSMMRTKAGDLVLSFAGSNARNWVGAYYAYRLAGGAVGGPVLMRRGEGYFDSHRWGDYSAATLDPENGTAIWIVQEYARAASGISQDWGTWIGQLQLPP